MPKSPFAVSDGLRTTTPPAASRRWIWTPSLPLPAGIGNGQALRIERQVGLVHMDVAGEDGAVGAVLDLEAVGARRRPARCCRGP